MCVARRSLDCVALTNETYNFIFKDFRPKWHLQLEGGTDFSEKFLKERLTLR